MMLFLIIHLPLVTGCASAYDHCVEHASILLCLAIILLLSCIIVVLSTYIIRPKKETSAVRQEVEEPIKALPVAAEETKRAARITVRAMLPPCEEERSSRRCRQAEQDEVAPGFKVMALTMKEQQHRG